MRLRALLATMLVVTMSACGGSSSTDTPPPATNVAPVANSGSAQSVGIASTVTLDGTASSDANGDTLAYAWVLTSKPAGSTAALSSPTASRPVFVPDVAGSYVFTLVVSDGSLQSTSASVTITSQRVNRAPSAIPGPGQNVLVSTTVTLDATASLDPDGDQITYSWTLATRPATSSSVLTGASTSKPIFVPDVVGTYVSNLITSDGLLSSSTATVTVTAASANVAPVASAGTPKSVLVGSMVTLNGSASSDANGDTLTYAWSIVTRPAGSVSVVSNATSVSPTFIPDVAGTYAVSLVVSDGTVASAASTVSVVAGTANVPPVANAGSPQNTFVGTTVALNGSNSSDANNRPLTYNWQGVSRPTGSLVELSSTSIVTTTFVPDVAGTYVISLVVNNGISNSAVSTVSVTASAPPAPPAVTLYLYGGFNNSVYLGCLTCNQFHTESVCNLFGTYGSAFSINGIWNQFGTYGSSFSLSSPWNSFSLSGPSVIGSDGLFYGHFTTNLFQINRTTIQGFVNVLNFYTSTGSLTSTRSYACGN